MSGRSEGKAVGVRQTEPGFAARTRPPPFMAEFAIISTLLLIAAPVVLVGATLAAAAKKRLSNRA